MWIRARFFATSKRRERRRVLRLGLAVLLAAHLFFGCVVTDKITFDEAVNHPIALLALDPKEHVLVRRPDDKVPLTAEVWDPDVLDPDNQNIGARLTYNTDYWDGSRTQSCEPPEPLYVHDYDVEGTPFRLVCNLDLSGLGLIDNSLLSVEMTVSDLGFRNDDQPRKGAYLLTLDWTVRIAQEQ